MLSIALVPVKNRSSPGLTCCPGGRHRSVVAARCQRQRDDSRVVGSWDANVFSAPPENRLADCDTGRQCRNLSLRKRPRGYAILHNRRCALLPFARVRGCGFERPAKFARRDRDSVRRTVPFTCFVRHAIVVSSRSGENVEQLAKFANFASPRFTCQLKFLPKPSAVRAH